MEFCAARDTYATLVASQARHALDVNKRLSRAGREDAHGPGRDPRRPKSLWRGWR